MRQLFISVFAVLLSLSVSARINTQDFEQEYRERFECRMKKSHTLGLSFALVSKDSVIVQYNLGYSDEELTEQVTSRTLFGLGSVTKVLTGAAVMQLQGQGLIELDSSLQKYLPNFEIKGDHRDEVTVRRVMTHHAGLPSDIVKGMFTQYPEPYERTLGYINDEYLAMRPGQVRAYSNPGYTLLGHMIKSVSGISYPTYLNDSVLLKLGINESGFNLRERASATFDNKGKSQQEALLRDIPAGSLYSNMQDMVLFLQAYLNQDEDLFSKEAYRQIFEEQHKGLPLNFDDHYALGWAIAHEEYAGKVYTHTGAMMYFNSAIAGGRIGRRSPDQLFRRGAILSTHDVGVERPSPPIRTTDSTRSNDRIISE